jgi:hypothetical protein
MKLNEFLNRLNEVEDVEDIEVEHPGLLEVPKGKEVDDLPLSHFKSLVEKKGYEEVIRGLQNLRRWNKNRDTKLSNWADDIMDRMKDWVEKKREDNPDFAK